MRCDVCAEGTAYTIQARAGGRTADYLIARMPVDGDRMFAVGVVRRTKDGSAWYVALEAAATDVSTDWTSDADLARMAAAEDEQA